MTSETDDLSGEPLDEKRWTPGLEVKAKSIDESARTLVATVSTDMVDRDEEIVMPGAFRKRIKSYRKNPVLLWMHNALITPIGKALDITVTEKGIDAVLYFRPDNELADDVFRAYQQGVLTSFSVGFRTYKREKGASADGQPSVIKITDAELFEISAVTIPANTEATVKHARINKLLQEATLSDKTQGETIYAVPSDLDVMKRAAQLGAKAIEDGRNGKALAGEMLAAAQEIRRVFSALAAPSAADESDAEVLRVLRSTIDIAKA